MSFAGNNLLWTSKTYLGPRGGIWIQIAQFARGQQPIWPQPDLRGETISFGGAQLWTSTPQGIWLRVACRPEFQWLPCANVGTPIGEQSQDMGQVRSEANASRDHDKDLEHGNGDAANPAPGEPELEPQDMEAAVELLSARSQQQPQLGEPSPRSRSRSRSARRSASA